MRYFVHDLETDKLRIHTGGKADWLTIAEADRDPRFSLPTHRGSRSRGASVIAPARRENVCLLASAADQ